jgi:small subunit ribosomal protein S1
MPLDQEEKLAPPSAAQTAGVEPAPEPIHAEQAHAVEKPAAEAEPASPQKSSPAAAESARAPETAVVSAAIEKKPGDAATETVAKPVAESEKSEDIPAAEAKQATEAAAETETEPTMEQAMEQMDQLLGQYSSPKPAAAEGETLQGRVVAIIELGVVVDIGAKLEGLIPAQELADLGTPLPFESGQTIEVERTKEQKDGYILLSHLRAYRRHVWEKIEKAYRGNETITAKIVDRIKGGLVADIGVRAFLPASQVDLKPVQDLDAWKDRSLEVRVLKLNRKRGNVVVSRRAILEEAQKAHRDEVMAGLTEGSIVHGKVKNLTDYGVFVDLGGVDGLLHVSDLTWGRITKPSELVKQGDEIDVQVLKFDREKGRISLGKKQLEPDPWATVPERFPAGTRTQGKVVGVTDYGAFVQIEPGVEGLVHVSEMTWSRRMKHPSKIVKAGDEVEVTVLDVKPEQRRISLGLKQTLPDPWDGVAEKFSPGMLVTGTVRNVTDFGAFVEVEEGIEGLIHVGDISWTERVKHPGEKFKKGGKVEAKVLKVDTEHRRLSLGVKQLNDPMADWLAAHKTGEVVRGKVVRLAAFGAFVEVAVNVEGLCHISEIEDRRSKGDRDKPQARDANKMGTLAVGQEYDFKIIRLEPEQRKISLSYRGAVKQAEKQEMKEFRATTTKSSPTATIGDAILAKLKSS